MALPDRPAPRALDRSAVERVLGRAAELQARDTGDGAVEALTEAQLVELGREVGLSPEHLRQALAEERTRVPALVDEAARESGLLDAVIGGATVAAQRAIRVEAPTALAQLDRWMRDVECLTVMRRFEDRVLWEPRRGFVAQVRVNLNLGGRPFALARADMVAATAVALADGRTLVRLDATFAGARRRSAGGTGIAATFGVGASGAALAIGIMAPVAALPALVLGAGALYDARRRQRAMLGRGGLALEQILDGLERGELARSAPFTIFQL